MVERNAIENFFQPHLPLVSSGEYLQLHKTAPFIDCAPPRQKTPQKLSKPTKEYADPTYVGEAPL